MLSAVGSVHSERGHNKQPFQDACKDCWNMELKYGDHNNGCIRHRGSPCLWRRGDPRTQEVVTNAIKQAGKDSASYVAQGDSPLLPNELISLRASLLQDQNPLWGFMIWVMILIGCKLFLREEEVRINILYLLRRLMF